ncbi:MAG: response regulator, partial [Verrucomicrobia bacterium]|nr:response regulator [Verrucomicrobiota bacterium]
EDQLHQAAKMEALGVLAGGLAHDFNNVLAIVLGNAELALTTVPQDGETYEMLKDIVKASRSATELCGQMLAYAGRGIMTTQQLECNAMIRELGGLLQVALPKKASIEYQLCDEPLFVEGDKAKLDQVIMNLITNAAEALENEVGRVVASTGIRTYDADELERFQPGSQLAPGPYIWIKVSDTGCGMSLETQKKIFDPFFTTKFTGRGLGLAAVRGIILRHGGGVGIESEVGKGTTFTVFLPSVNAPKKHLEPLKEGSQNFSAKRVLVVDDEVEVRKTLERILRKAGFAVSQAGGGREAIEVFRKEQESIDCVLLDLSMPELDGVETFRELQKIRHDVRVLLNSGYAEQDVLNRVQGAGFAGVLQKPIAGDVLVARIHRVAR